MIAIETLLVAAGLLHFGILVAGALVPRVLDWRTELAGLRPMTRHLVWVHGSFVVLVVLGFGLLSVLFAGTLATGTPLARALCAFMALFWGARLTLQFALFDARPHLTSSVLRWGHRGLTATFLYFVLVYAWAAFAR